MGNSTVYSSIFLPIGSLLKVTLILFDFSFGCHVAGNVNSYSPYSQSPESVIGVINLVVSYRNDSFLRRIFGEGNKYPNVPLSSDDQSSALSNPMLRLTTQAIITMKIAITWQMKAILMLLLLTRVD